MTHDEARTASRELLHPTAQETAALLGDGWSYQPPDPDEGNRQFWAYITHPSGKRLTIQSSHNPGRFTVYGDWPKTADGVETRPGYGETPPSITVGMNRGAKALAREIERRFFPEYFRQWEILKKQADESDAYYIRVDQLARELATLMPGADVLSDRRKGTECYPNRTDARNAAGKIHWYDSETGYGDVSVHGDATANLDLHAVPLSIVRKILATYGEAIREKGKGEA